MAASKAKDQVTGSGARATAKEVAEQSPAAAEHGPTTRQASCPRAPSPARAGTLAQGLPGGVLLPSPTSLSTNPSDTKRLLRSTAEPLERAPPQKHHQRKHPELSSSLRQRPLTLLQTDV